MYVLSLLLTFTVGYQGYFYNFKHFLEQQSYASRIKVVGKRDAIATGRFEVSLLKGGDKHTKELIHSKKQGMGWPKGNEKKAALAEKIETALLVFEKEMVAAS